MLEDVYSALASLSAGRVVLILLIAAVGAWVNRRYTEKLGTRLLSVGRGTGDPEEQERQVSTLTGFVRRGVGIAIILLAILSLLPEAGIEIAPLITAAGIGGLAIGFGAQNLVRDIIGGFFLLLENQIRVGDVVEVDNTSGLVHSVNLRTTILRDLSGVVHVIPNGSITKVSNMTKEWSRAVLDIRVAYKENVDHVMDVLRQIGEELYDDPEYRGLIVEPLQVLGVNEFTDSAVVIRIMITTKPLQQWAIGRELRRRIKNRFEEVGIEIPFPHHTLYWGDRAQGLPNGEDPKRPAGPIEEAKAAGDPDDPAPSKEI